MDSLLHSLSNAFRGRRYYCSGFLPETSSSAHVTDFKSNEYASLLGGKFFEPAEEQSDAGFSWGIALCSPRLC